MARSRSAERSRELEYDHNRKRRRSSPTPSPPRKRQYDSRDSPRREHRSSTFENSEERERDRRDGRYERARGDSDRSYRDSDRQRDSNKHRDDNKHQDSDTRKEKPDGNQPGGKADAAEPDKPSNASLTTTVAPSRERAALKAGPAGGAYIPPFRLRAMMKEANDKTSPEFQRMTWDALRKSLNGLINKVNVNNIKDLLPEIFGENLIRGRGVFCRSLMKSQLASPSFTPTYASLVAIINTKFPEIGELLLKRVISQFLKAFKRNDKNMAVGCLKFIAHLCNQQVAHEALALEIMVLLVDNPSDDSVEMALEFARDVAALLDETSPQSFTVVQDRLRNILQEGILAPRIQMLIQNFFSAVSYGVIDPDSAKEKARLKQQEDSRRLGFPDRPVHGLPPRIPAGLDLVDAADARCHNYGIDSTLEREIGLDIFRVDPNYEQHEAEYKAIKDEILGTGDSDGDEEDDGEEGDEEESGSEDEEQEQQQMQIQDQTQTDLINLRRTIYLTIMSSAQFEEAGHKLMKIQLRQGQEIEVVTMLIECCSQEKTYISYYGHLSQRFCNINKTYQALFEECFSKQYGLIHRLETNKLRNVARLFAHLLTTDAISWSVLACIRLTEEDTTSSSRIFIKILFQDLSENLGLLALNTRLQEPTLQLFFQGIFPKDTPRNMRFSINFFTSIGLGGLTDNMREHLKNLPRLIATQPAADESSSSDDSSSDDSSSDSDSDSDSSSSSDSSDSGSSSSDSDSDSSSSSSSDDEEEEAPRRKGSTQPSAASHPASSAHHRRRGQERETEPDVADLSLDRHPRDGYRSSRSDRHTTDYKTNGREEQYEKYPRSSHSRRDAEDDRTDLDRQVINGRRYPDESYLSRYGIDDRSKRDQRTYAEMERHRSYPTPEHENPSRRKGSRRDENGRREDDYDRHEHSRSRRERSYRDDDAEHDRRRSTRDDDRWDGRG